MTNCVHWVGGQLLSGIIFGRLKEGFVHWHLRGIDFSLAVVDGAAIAYNRGTESRLKSIHWPCIRCQSVFYRSLRHNYYCQQRQVGQGQWAFYFFRCLWICVKAWSVELFSKNLSLWEGGGGKGEGSDGNDSNKSRFEYFFGAPFLNLYNFHFRICN